MTQFRAVLTGFGVVITLTSRAFGQSPFAVCGDSVPNRIVSTGPVRAVIATIDGLRVCLAVEGITDSSPIHPRDWRQPSRFVVLETRVPGDARRMQESQVLTSWTKNDSPLPNDSTAGAWRAAVIEVAAAKWDAAARRMERQELTNGIAGLLAQRNWIQGQIDTIRHRDDSLRLAVSEGLGRARLDKQRSFSSASQYESAARSRLSKAQSALASATASGDQNRIQSARQSVAAAEENVRTAADRVRSIQAIVPESSVSGIQDLLDRLDAKGRVATLTAMLADLDVDNRVTAWRAALAAIDSQPDPEDTLRSAAARLRSILSR